MGFFSNNCRYDGCGLKCSSLHELVEHIEQIHVPYSDAESESSMFGISPSTVLRLCPFQFPNGPISQTSTSSLISSASDYEDAASDSGQGSIDSSSLYNKSDSSNLTSPISLNGMKIIDVDKNNNPILVVKNDVYICGVENCQKSYKSISNLTQHRQMSHNIITELSDRYSCVKCRRSYKTPKGLKSHQRNSNCSEYLPGESPPIVRILKPADQNSAVKKIKTIAKKLTFPKKIIDVPKISALQQHLLTPVISKPI